MSRIAEIRGDCSAGFDNDIRFLGWKIGRIDIDLLLIRNQLLEFLNRIHPLSTPFLYALLLHNFVPPLLSLNPQLYLLLLCLPLLFSAEQRLL